MHGSPLKTFNQSDGGDLPEEAPMFHPVSNLEVNAIEDADADYDLDDMITAPTPNHGKTVNATDG